MAGTLGEPGWLASARFTHVGAIVRDVDRTTGQLSEVYGLGPWQKREVVLDETTLRGRRTRHNARIASVNVAGLAVALSQPLDGYSIYNEFLEHHGEGLHHIGVAVPDARAVAAEMAGHGVGVIQEGTTSNGGHFALLEGSKSAGIIFRLISDSEQAANGPVAVPPASALSPLSSARFDQVGVIVRDVHHAVDRLSENFGIGPWTLTETTVDAVGRHGEPVSARLSMAFARLGPFELELIETLGGRTVHLDDLEANGEGIHHVRFQVPDAVSVLDEMARRGVGTVIRGSVPDHGIYYGYLEGSKSGGILFEIITMPAGFEIPTLPAENVPGA